MDLTTDEISRYGRHLILPEIGKSGQTKLKQAKVLLIGTGGLGSPQALYLAAAGVGTIGLVDNDTVDFSNLQRQVIHHTDDVGKPKVESAKEKIVNINPEVTVNTHQTRINAANAMEIISQYDIIVDGTDNFPSRYLINDACILAKKPNIYGAIYRFEGQCSVFGLEDGPCYRCFFQEPPKEGEVPSCAEAGVIGILPGIIGLLQSNEVIKLICNIGSSLSGRLIIFDALQSRFREVAMKKDPNCPSCGHTPSIPPLKDYKLTCTTTQKAHTMNNDVQEISPVDLKVKLDANPNEVYLLDVREENEWEIANIKEGHLKPLSTLDQQYNDIPKDKDVYVYCKLGGRSAKAIEFLKSQGYTNLINLAGGIDAWAKEVDTSMPTY